MLSPNLEAINLLDTPAQITVASKVSVLSVFGVLNFNSTKLCL